MRALVLVILSLTLFVADRHFQFSNTLRSKASFVIVSIQHVVVSPWRWAQSLVANFASKQQALNENANLYSKLALANIELQRLSFLEYENSQLRKLLGYAELHKVKILPAELLTTVASSFSQQMIINRGKQHGVCVGQVVLDVYGLFGRIVEVGQEMSRVMLITHSKSAVPVLITRNGLQAVALGTGGSYLELANVPETADVKEGDALVTSGLDKIFPAGCQVGTVEKIKHIVGNRFMNVLVATKAQIGKGLYVFLI